jgi:hypothetical protein
MNFPHNDGALGGCQAHHEAWALVPLFIAPSQPNTYLDKDLFNGPLTPIDYMDGDHVMRAYDAKL